MARGQVLLGADEIAGVAERDAAPEQLVGRHRLERIARRAGRLRRLLDAAGAQRQEHHRAQHHFDSVLSWRCRSMFLSQVV
jgi:hypothetical protein